MKKHNQFIRLGLAVLCPVVAVLVVLAAFAPAQAFDEETGLLFYDPYTMTQHRYTDTVSSVHFDLVGALAIAAGFSITDANTIQLYSQLTDSSVLPKRTEAYSFTAQTFPTAPPLDTVTPNAHCPSPSTTPYSVTMGSTNMLECDGCFTSRLGPYAVFFHMAHDRPEELGAIKEWAFGRTDNLTAIATFGYSSTAPFVWQNFVNIYDTTACFVTQTVAAADTGGIEAGSLQALGIYLHSLGDHWSHQECIKAADAAGKPFAAHVLVTPDHELAPCNYLAHSLEFGDPEEFPASNRTYTATLKIYEALVAFATASDRPRYHPIPVTAEDNHIADTLYEFAHTDGNDPHTRREIAEDLRLWALQTRAANPTYWRNATTVCPSGCDYSSISEALADAQAGDTIAVLAGTYTETISLKDGVQVQGVPLLTILEGNGNGPVVSATGSDILSDTVLSGFVIRGGNAKEGAGLYIAGGASPTLSGLVVRNNGAERGAGMFVTGSSSPRLERSTFFSNTAESGAAIYLDGASATIQYNAFELNTTGTGTGGAIMLSNSSATVYSNTFAANVAGVGGALVINSGSPTIDSNVLAGNVAGVGGGIAVGGGRPLIRNNIAISNTAATGSGISIRESAEPTITNNLITNNVGGAGIYIEGSTGTIGNNTIANHEGAGVYLVGSSARPTIVNNIIVHNDYGINGPTRPASQVPGPTIGHNNIWGNTDGDFSGPESITGQEGTNGNISADPLFTGLPGIAEPIGGYFLSQTGAGQSATSPAVDAGSDSASALELDGRTTRTDGVPDSDTIDMGFHYRVPRFETLVTPLAGGHLTFTGNTSITVDFPPFTVGEAVTLTTQYTGRKPLPTGLDVLDSPFSIEAYNQNGEPVTTFSDTFTLTVHYDDDDSAGLSEESLALYYWHEESTSWKSIPTESNAANNILWTTLDHLTTFAVLGEKRYQLYLPVTTR